MSRLLAFLIASKALMEKGSVYCVIFFDELEFSNGAELCECVLSDSATDTHRFRTVARLTVISSIRTVVGLKVVDFQDGLMR